MAADDKAKKTKIDLKARLGRTTQIGIAPPPGAPMPTAPGATPPPPPSDRGDGVGSGPVAPPAPSSRPSVPGSVAPPPGIAPPPLTGLSPGIPAPLFAPARPVARAEPKPSAAQQTIKVEVGEEIHEERKKWRNRMFMAAGGGALVGILIGFVAGGSSEKGDRSKIYARNAASVEKDVKAANEKLKELDAKITEAAEKIGRKEFPDGLSALSGIVIPYEETILDKQVAPTFVRRVATFFNGVKNINGSRETLKKLSDFAKDPVTKYFKEETAPMANYSVIFRSDGSKVVADLVPNPTPFAWKGDWAASYKVSVQQGGKATDKEVKRYSKGDLPGNDAQGIPVDPKSMATLGAGVALYGQVLKAIGDIRAELQGKPDDPNAPPGLLKAGDDLAVELHKTCVATLDAAACK